MPPMHLSRTPTPDASSPATPAPRPTSSAAVPIPAWVVTLHAERAAAAASPVRQSMTSVCVSALCSLFFFGESQSFRGPVLTRLFLYVCMCYYVCVWLSRARVRAQTAPLPPLECTSLCQQLATGVVVFVRHAIALAQSQVRGRAQVFCFLCVVLLAGRLHFVFLY